METTDDLRYWLLLQRVPGLGDRTFLQLLEVCSPKDVFGKSAESLKNLRLKDKSCAFIKKPDWSLVDADIKWFGKPNNHIITITDDSYPSQLKEIDSPPPLLFVKGDIGLLSQPQIAIVGSRNPSVFGEQTALQFAKSLARSGFVITSGLALGIDAASHQGALNAKAATIAVVGTGLDRVYPSRHKKLAQEIAEQGAIISEFPFGTAPAAGNFPRRNRIIAGLSAGLLVVEATLKSGSLITAKMALKANREVFAIPGAINNPLAHGCNQLIKESAAKLVEAEVDIFAELGEHQLQLVTQEQEKSPAVNLDNRLKKLLNFIMYSPTSIDWMVEKSGYSAQDIISMAVELELQGFIAPTVGGYSRIK